MAIETMLDVGIPSDEERRRFDQEGYLTIPGALSPGQVERLLDAHDRVAAEEAAAGRLGPNGSVHLFAFVLRDPSFLELLDLPTTFRFAWGFLGWNIFMYHCHLDVHPPVPAGAIPAWGWHQDGGRQNLEIESVPRPRLSVKVALFLSDVSEPGRGNFTIVPGSHLRNSIPRPEHPEEGFANPDGAVPVLAEPGTAVIFDRRLWHARSVNHSTITRKAVFLGYTYRWVRSRDDLVVDPEVMAGLNPVRRQLLGDGLDAMSYWGLGDDAPPLRSWLQERGLLDPSLPGNR